MGNANLRHWCVTVEEARQAIETLRAYGVPEELLKRVEALVAMQVAINNRHE